MRLLQVVLAAGILVNLAVAESLYGYDDNYYNIYDYDNYYDDDYDNEEDAAPLNGSATEAESEPEVSGGEDHQHHHHPPAETPDVAVVADGDDETLPEDVLLDDLVPEEDVGNITAEGGTEDKSDSSATESSEELPEVAVHSMVPIHKIPESCNHAPDPGVCRGHFPMFYFDPVTRTCLQFVYGGCRGNSNAFRTASECYAKCHPVGFTRGAGKGDDYLKLHEGKGERTFTFPGQDAALRVDDATLADFSVRNVYLLEFSFRTDSPHGLIAFLRQTSVPLEVGNRKVQLYVFLRRGHLGVTHIFCHNRETFLMKKGGLQGGNWHSSMVKVNSGTGELLLEVDGFQETFTIASLRDQPNFGSFEGGIFTSRLWIGGVYEEEVRQEAMVERIANFHGCLQKVALMSGETSEEIVWHKGIRSSTYRSVKENCQTNCNDRSHNLCSSNSNCVEHFDHSTCSCFGSGLDGPRCANQDIPILALSTDGHVVHRLYEWMDRVHTYTNFISLEFRTRFADSILFYGSTHYPEKQYIAATLTAAGSVFVEANLGGGSVNTEVGERQHTGTWRTLTLVHQHNRIQVYLNSRLQDTLIMPGEVRYFHLDPEFYFGSAPNLTRTCGLRHDGGIREGYSCQNNQRRYYYDVHDAECRPFNYSGCGGNGNNFPDHHTCMHTCNYQGLRSMNSFLGCMRNVFINDVSVLWELKDQSKSTRYVGATEDPPITDTCKDREQMVLLTLPTEKAHVNLTNPDPENFRLVVSFRPTKPRGVVASGYVDTVDYRSVWEIYHDEQHVSFVIHEDQLHVKPNTKISIGNWQFVDVSYRNGKMVMKVNHKTVSKNAPGPLTFFPSVTLGLSPLQEYPGMIGSVRKVELGGQKVELRSLVGTDVAQKNVIYDGGRVLGLCERPGSCEHGSTCTVDDKDEIRCDCTDSGYTGKTCQFSLYKTSCEQYRHSGYNTSGVYKIDVDGNGPLPPSFVRCDFNDLTGVTSTIVENNLPEKYEVRGRGLGNVELQVQYRDFTPEMLQVLVTKSESCTQKVRYDCRRSPLKLSTHTWFSSPSEPYISSFGSKVPGLCRCKEIGACDKHNIACNCDAVDGLARFDKAVISDPNLLPLTSMYFLEDKEGMREESEGRISLGPLTCIKEATAEQTVSFSKDNVFLEVPAWREGSLSLTFKTTSTRAIIAYQPAYHVSHATFRMALLGEKEIELMYSFNGLEHRHSLHTTRSLNTGEWQHVAINIYHGQLRFLVNSEQKLIDIDDNANLGVLDGSMFIGGMPPKQPRWMNHEMEEEKLGSLNGCIRDLTLNDEMIDLDRYVRVAPLGVSSSCRASCDSNPCKNGAECVENWGSYKCVCKNPLAHSGTNCENNMNEDAVTFPTQESMLKYFVNDTAEMATENLLNSTSISLNFRTNVRQGLILFTYDYLHNFLQLHLAAPNQLVLLFNSGKQALSLTVETTGEVVLNKGQSVQVALERDTTSTTLSVFTSGAFFNASVNSGLLLLEEMDYNQFPFGESTLLPGMVDYPHSFTKPSPFFMVYVGSANDPQWAVEAEVSGFVGCVRGLQADSEALSLHRLLNQHPAPGVKKDCYMMCDAQPCLNGGTCTEDFEYPTNFYCNCSGTSYSGPVCSTETAYLFSGSEWLSRDAATSPLVENLVFELAFSASVRRQQHQLVAFLRSTSSSSPDDYILVAVESDGTVVVRALVESLAQDTTLVARASPEEGINTFSGSRHVVRVEWKSSGLMVTVDRKEQVIQEEDATYRDEASKSPRSLYLGGVEEGVDSRLLDYDNFHGCISNVMISNPTGKVYPLVEYSEKDFHITNFGLPKYGSCAGSPVQPAMVVMHRASKVVSMVKGEEWSVRAAPRMPYEAPPPMAAPKRDTPMDNVVPAVATSVLLVAAIIVGILCIRSDKSKRRKAKEAERKDQEEKEALLKGRKKSREEAMKTRITATTDVEMATVKAAPNGGTPVQENVMTINEVNQQKAPPKEPPKEPPPPIPSEEPEEGEVEVRTPKETTGDRPLSWDKSADTLPLIIGTQDLGVGVPDSPSSMRVNRGSNTMVYIDEDTDADSEPRLLRHGSLPGEDEPEEVVEPPFVATKIQLLGDGEVQKIVKSEDEDEIVVVDDYLEDKTATTAKPDNVEADLENENQVDPSISQQKETDLAEAAQESTQMPSETEAKIDQAIESATEEQENTKEDKGKETDDNPPEEKEKEVDAQRSSEKKAEGEEKKENEDADKLGGDEKKRSSDSDSDDGFIELQPESEKVQDSERETSQPN